MALIRDWYLSALGDSDKADETIDAQFYEGQVDAFINVLALLTDHVWPKVSTRVPAQPAPTEPPTDDLGKFLRTYDPKGNKVLFDLDLDQRKRDQPDAEHPFILVRFGGRVLVLNPMDLQDHLCIDAHPFIDGQEAAVGAFGLSQDEPRLQFPTTAKRTSHGWPAARLVSLLLGKQATTPTTQESA